jgi:outer membrane receptor for ferrienterochelin and colicin
VQVEGGREIRVRLAVPLTPDAEDRLAAWTLGTRSLGESVKSLTADQIRKRHVQTVADALRIIAPEMVGQETSQVGGRPALRNRGAPTLVGDQEPLVILDGIPVPQGSLDALAGLNPGDIERIEVMRGGAGGWRYGIQGANGVVRITTRDASGGYESATPPSECAFRFPR